MHLHFWVHNYLIFTLEQSYQTGLDTFSLRLFTGTLLLGVRFTAQCRVTSLSFSHVGRVIGAGPVTSTINNLVFIPPKCLNWHGI